MMVVDGRLCPYYMILNHTSCSVSINCPFSFVLFLVQVSGDAVTVFVFDYTDKSPDDVSLVITFIVV